MRYAQFIHDITVPDCLTVKYSFTCYVHEYDTILPMSIEYVSQYRVTDYTCVYPNGSQGLSLDPYASMPGLTTFAYLALKLSLKLMATNTSRVNGNAGNNSQYR